MSLNLKNLKKIFKSDGVENIAVDNFNLDIKEGQLVTFLGPSGCGKTTTLRMVSGFENPSAGNIILDEKDITNDPPNKRDISMMFQSYALFPHMNVRENIEFGLKLKKFSKKRIKEKADKIIELTGLSGMEKRRPDQISGGQQQRVALARSLVMEPKVLLFDEPLSNLDAKLRESMRLEIRRIQKELNITSIYVTHDQIEAMSISDLIVIMDKGKIMQIGSPYEIYSKPQNKFVADFIGNVNFLEGKISYIGEDYIKVFNKELNEEFIGYSDKELKKDDEVYIVLRPEGINTKKENRENYISGIIDKYVFLGSNIELDIRLKNGKLLHVNEYNIIEKELPVIGKNLEVYFSKKNSWIIKK
ncbi:ABC transporter ATP-binding protein [Oceanotoga sp. DSM 15011]|uniref:Iron(III) transport system ATP-binding protein n=1 Tax=Oceanotoga teriensis TaxID=515440 RepID=A0AA45HHY1_9BACT|nr:MULTISPECIES: ABC transporter ATP-binding protein [Oceanotoga]PWJ87883.1 iron(III) transport system ATP-binding protein [Oceanotoga teriensis]UYO99240.1 ABC transporter ATP-binding protein [Oceanotoga sp. DSM 15011]